MRLRGLVGGVMRISDICLLSVLLLFVNEVQTNQNGASLSLLIQELAPIARLTSGIVMTTELAKDSNKMNEVVAEFLGVGSGEDVAKLKGLKVEEVAKELGELYATVEKVPELKVDMDALAKSFEVLDTMKQNSAVLERNLTDPSDELEKDLELARVVSPNSFIDLSRMKEIVDQLEFIKANEDIEEVEAAASNHLVPLYASLAVIHPNLILLKDFEKNFEPLLKLENISERLQDFEEMAELSKLFVDNFESFSSMATKLNDMQTGVKSLRTVMDMQKSVPELANDLRSSSDAVKKLSSKKAVLKLTAGLSGGVGDLKLMFDDLESGKLKQLVAKGKDMKDLQKSLISLFNIHTGLEVLVSTWSQLNQRKRTDSLDKLVTILGDVLKNNQSSSDTEVLANSLGPLTDCFTDLQLPKVVPDSRKAAALGEFVKNLGARIKLMKQFLKNNFASDLPSDVSFMMNLLRDIHAKKTNIKVQRAAWHEVRNSSKTDYLIEELNRIHGEYEKIKDQSPFDTLREAVDLSVITPVLMMSSDTKLEEMLTCLQKNSYDSDLLTSTLNFGKSVQEMKSMKTEFNSTQTFLNALSNVKREVLKVSKLTRASKKLRLRRRRAPNQKSLDNLKTTVATDLGSGVQVLRELAKILKNEASVKVAVEADDGLKNAIAAIPEAQNVWTEENRKAMSKMLVDLKEVDKYSGTVKTDNLSSLWTIFDEAQKVEEVKIADAKVFDDPISTVLASSSNPKIKGASGDFKTLGSLDLNFAQHRNDLKAAFFTLQPLQQFFDDFFGNTKTPGSVQSSEKLVTEEPSSSGMGVVGAIIGGLLFLGAVGGAGYYLRDKAIQKEKFKHKERYWVYEGVYYENMEKNVFYAAKDGRVRTLKKCIAEGRCLDFYHNPIKMNNLYSWQTPLHVAVENCHSEIVELLIRGGADRSLLSQDEETAEQLMEKLLIKVTDPKALAEDDAATKEKKKENEKELQKIKAIFKKYEKKKFQPRIADVLPVDQFSIKCVVKKPKPEAGEKVENQEKTPEKNKEVVDKFQKKFEELVHNASKENYRPVTHAVFDTNPDGVLDLDEMDLDGQLHFFEAVFKPGQLAVKSDWLTECLKDRKNFHKDYDYRITKVKINGNVHDTLDEWTKWSNFRNIPCLLGAITTCAIGYTDTTDPTAGRVENIVKCLGATFWIYDFFAHSTCFYQPPRKPHWFPEKQAYWIVCNKNQKKKIDERQECAAVDQPMWPVVFEDFFEFLLSMRGPPKLTKKEDKDKQGSTQKTAPESNDSKTPLLN